MGLESHSDVRIPREGPLVPHVRNSNLKNIFTEKSVSRTTSAEVLGPGGRVRLSGNQQCNDMMIIISLTRLFLSDDVMSCGLR